MPLTAPSFWVRFWHEPVRAERLAAVRLFLGLALVGELLITYPLIFADVYGPHGVGYAGLHDRDLLNGWLWTILFFRTDDLNILWAAYGVWLAVAFAFAVGWRTRLMNVLLWLITMCFLNRNVNITNNGDDLLQCVLFLLMWMPSGKALSVDHWLALRRRRRQGMPTDDLERPMVAPWGVRLLQIQLCMVYFTTGIAKLSGGWEKGTWWLGTSVHYVLLDCTMARVSSAQVRLPFWMTAAATWTSVWWEVLFPALVCLRWTRRWALLVGVLFHLGIYATLEVGWFSFYTLAVYGVWIPGEFWDRVLRKASRRREPPE